MNSKNVSKSGSESKELRMDELNGMNLDVLELRIFQNSVSGFLPFTQPVLILYDLDFLTHII